MHLLLFKAIRDEKASDDYAKRACLIAVYFANRSNCPQNSHSYGQETVQL